MTRFDLLWKILVTVSHCPVKLAYGNTGEWQAPRTWASLTGGLQPVLCKIWAQGQQYIANGAEECECSRGERSPVVETSLQHCVTSQNNPSEITMDLRWFGTVYVTVRCLSPCLIHSYDDLIRMKVMLSKIKPFRTIWGSDIQNYLIDWWRHLFWYGRIIFIEDSILKNLFLMSPC